VKWREHGEETGQGTGQKTDRLSGCRAPASSLPDRGEDISQMEPMLIAKGSKHRDRMNELVFELSASASAFRASLPEGMVEALCDLVRSMN
jgi:hypothetical protein